MHVKPLRLWVKDLCPNVIGRELFDVLGIKSAIHMKPNSIIYDNFSFKSLWVIKRSVANRRRLTLWHFLTLYRCQLIAFFSIHRNEVLENVRHVALNYVSTSSWSVLGGQLPFIFLSLILQVSSLFLHDLSQWHADVNIVFLFSLDSRRATSS